MVYTIAAAAEGRVEICVSSKHRKVVEESPGRPLVMFLTHLHSHMSRLTYFMLQLHDDQVLKVSIRLKCPLFNCLLIACLPSGCLVEICDLIGRCLLMLFAAFLSPSLPQSF